MREQHETAPNEFTDMKNEIVGFHIWNKLAYALFDGQDC